MELQLRQSQVQIMSQEMQESLRLLELPLLELNTYLTEQASANPLLDFSESYPLNSRYSLGDWKREIPAEEGLLEYLDKQLGFLEVSTDIQKIIRFLIGSLDSSGYLRASITDLAKDLRVSQQSVNAALEILQRFDPAGIGARTLGECLLLQLERFGIRDGLAVAVIQDHLFDVANGSLKKIAKERQCSLKEVQDAINLIKSLNPRPGQIYGSSQAPYILPDIYIHRIDGEYLILPNKKSNSLLNVNREYVRLIDNPTTDSETRNYLKQKYSQALHVINNLHKRNLTLISIVEVLVEEQRLFFDEGIDLKPLTREVVAKRLGLHESTVSRAVRDKYISTPYGVFPLAFFFSSTLSGISGEVSSISVKDLLRGIVAGEDPLSPYTDSALQELLAKEGITISRRTVAKYRNQLGIPPVKLRIRY